jgi:hypothetical protein
MGLRHTGKRCNRCGHELTEAEFAAWLMSGGGALEGTIYFCQQCEPERYAMAMRRFPTPPAAEGSER